MKSIENAVITAIYDALNPEYPGIMVYGDATAVAETFPCVSAYEADNSTAADTLDSSGREKFSDAMYQIDVYSNLDQGRKAQCRKILEIIDQKLTRFGLVRTTTLPTPNLNDNNIYRLTARYTARIGDNNTVYRR